MKKYGILIAVLVLTAALLTGCRNPGTTPTELPSTQGATLMPTTEATTMPTTMPTTETPTSAATETDGAGSEGNGGGESNPTDATGNANSRSRTPGMK